MAPLNSRTLENISVDALNDALRRRSLSMLSISALSVGGLSDNVKMSSHSQNPCLRQEEDCLTGSAPLLTSDDAVSASSDTDATEIASVHGEEVSSSNDLNRKQHLEFTTLRLTYLLVTLVIMLADGLQGTHLYVLYEGYGYSVASLYTLGWITGGLMSPITGPLIDSFGRKKAAILYCCLEILINWLEQYPMLVGLIASRMIGGFTTNLLSSVFETWLVTEFRRRGLSSSQFELIHRDSVIVSNCAAIASGCFSHALANKFGPVGPFKGAVTCTFIALGVVALMWSENYGSKDGQASKDMTSYFHDAVEAYKRDSKMLRVGIVQGFSEGSVNIFIFLWAPALALFAKNAMKDVWGLDKLGEPAYGLIFGAFMAAGVLGGLAAPRVRRTVSDLLSPVHCAWKDDARVVEVNGETVKVRPMAVEFLAASCYALSAALLLVPCIFSDDHEQSFGFCLVSFLLFEFLIGTFRPCEGVIRSLYFHDDARASIMSIPRIIVNVVVSVGVISTNFISVRIVFAAVAMLMSISSVLQLSLISKPEWESLMSRIHCALPSVLSTIHTGPRFVYSQCTKLLVHSSGANSKKNKCE